MFYTYIYRDPSRKNEPIYIGKGQNKRAWSHLKSKKKHPFIHRLRYMRENNINPSIEIINALDESHAFFLEECLISIIGRKDLGKGTLLNLTDGGDGGQRGAIRSDITRKKIASANIGKILTEETKNKMSIAGKGKKKPIRTTEHRKNMSASKKGSVPWNKGLKTGPESDETKKKKSIAFKGRPGVNKGKIYSQGYKDAQSLRMIEWWKTRKEQKND